MTDLKGLAQPEQKPVVKWDASAPLVVHPHPAFQAAPLQRKPEQELVIDCPRCGHCCPQRKPLTDAVLAEREACAQLCETKHFSSPIREAGAKICAAAIRARGQS